ncbi:restriction endonuclease subunit S [Clostridium perfringens]|nr:restriction endonuclease subunit S [Clostridium perfringens]MDK0949834.1 restriction endonuclease subunit S [Clostridium perfringens]
MKRIQKIKEVCTISGGYAFKSNDFTRQGIPIIRIGDISGNKVNISSGTVFFEEYNEKLNKFIIEKGDILVALSGATTGKFGIYDEEIQALLNQRVAKISPKENINNKYLYHYMNKLQNIIYNKALGCAQPNISPNEIGEIEIYVPSRLEQDKISDVLDIAKDLIDKRKKQIEELDLLVKSKFIEMFGDQNTNSKNLEKVYLKDISELITKGASPNWQGIEYVDDDTQTLFVTSENVREGYIDLSKKKYLMDAFNEKQKRSILNNGDFLINIVGASIGRAAQFNLDIKANINQAVALVRIKKGLVNDKYMLEYLNSPKALQMYKSMQVSVARANLSLQNINDLEILLPPMELQNQFANFVKQVDKLKFEMEKSLKELEDNFNSLMQKAFKGELFK